MAALNYSQFPPETESFWEAEEVPNHCQGNLGNWKFNVILQFLSHSPPVHPLQITPNKGRVGYIFYSLNIILKVYDLRPSYN